MASLKLPHDRFPHHRDPRSCPIHVGLANGTYVFVQDRAAVVYVLPDGPHLHAKVLGNCEPALYAGDLTILGGVIEDVTKLSGTFLFDDPMGLVDVAKKLVGVGFQVNSDALRFFPIDGSRPYIVQFTP